MKREASSNFFFLLSAENRGFLLSRRAPQARPSDCSARGQAAFCAEATTVGQNTECASMPVGDDMGFVTHRNSVYSLSVTSGKGDILFA